MGCTTLSCLVRCFLELEEVLSTPEESKKVGAVPRRIVDIVFHEIFWLATVYDPRLQYHVEKLPPLKKRGSVITRVR